ELGLPELGDWNRVRREVLSKLTDSEEAVPAKKIKSEIPRKILGASRAGLEGLRRVAFTRWTSPTTPHSDFLEAKSPAEPFDLSAFARTVLSAAKASPTGRFGPNKAFINHVWRYLGAEPNFPRLDLPEFKRRLVEANAARLLSLSRADMAPDLPTEDVRE